MGNEVFIELIKWALGILAGGAFKVYADLKLLKKDLNAAFTLIRSQKKRIDALERELNYYEGDNYDSEGDGSDAESGEGGFDQDHRRCG